MANDEPTFEDTIKRMTALSESLRARASKLIERADKVDAAIIVMQEEGAVGQIALIDREEASKDEAPLTPARGIADETIKMMAFIMKEGDTPLSEIREYMRTLGKDNYDTLRSQLAGFAEAKTGWLIRVRKGVYRITPLGATKCGLKYEARHAA